MNVNLIAKIIGYNLILWVTILIAVLIGKKKIWIVYGGVIGFYIVSIMGTIRYLTRYDDIYYLLSDRVINEIEREKYQMTVCIISFVISVIIGAVLIYFSIRKKKEKQLKNQGYIVDGKWIRWNWNGEKISYYCPKVVRVEFMQWGFVLTVVENGSQAYHYVSGIGKIICKCSEGHVLSIYEANKVHEINCNQINDMSIANGYIYVMHQNKEILVMTCQGELKTKIQPPDGFVYHCFINRDRVNVVCVNTMGNQEMYYSYDAVNKTWTEYIR